MAYIRRRTTKAGTLSTALVESYRDANGKPRQRLLANLHGEEDTLHALARLAVHRDRLRKERAELEPQLPHAEEFYKAVMINLGTARRRYSDDELKEIDRLMKVRKRLLNRVAEIDARLAEIQKERHCEATPEEIRAASNTYAAKLREDQTMALAMEFALAARKADLRKHR